MSEGELTGLIGCLPMSIGSLHFLTYFYFIKLLFAIFLIKKKLEEPLY